ncbi:MAG TPA: hypothetical protein V6C58_27165 [Allocoleopsis sp.]
MYTSLAPEITNSTYIQDMKPFMIQVDDMTLIKRFIQGEEIDLLCNDNLHVEVIGGICQLLGKNKKIIAMIKTVDKTKCALVRYNSEYWSVLNKLLQENHFIPVGESDLSGLMTYEYHEVPVGYRLHHTEAIALWKVWYPYSRNKKPVGIPLDILILVKNKWASIRDIHIHEGTLFVNTLFEQVSIHYNEKVVWISKVDLVTNNLLNNDDDTLFFNQGNQNTVLELNPDDNYDLPEDNTLIQLSGIDLVSPLLDDRTLLVDNTWENTQNLIEDEQEEEFYHQDYFSKNEQPTEIKISHEVEQKSLHIEDNNIHLADTILEVPHIDSIPKPQVIFHPADMNNVIRFRQGKLYIMTEIGEVVVEGSDYSFSINKLAS